MNSKLKFFGATALLLAAGWVQADGNDQCPGAPISPPLPFNDSGTTIGANNTVTTLPAGCSNYTTVAGPDKIYRLVVTTAGSLTVTVTPSGGYDTAIYITDEALHACPAGTGSTVPAGACVGGRDATLTDVAETLNLASINPGTYNLYVDSFYSAGSAGAPNRHNGPFTMAVSGTAVLGGGTSADTAITKTDGVASVTAGGNTTYTITASNAGPGAVTGATVADTFAASLTCTWTCVGAGGGTCTAAGSGNINDSVNMPSGASVTYTASCAINAGATGSLTNTATVTNPMGTTDPNAANNTATDVNSIIVPITNTYTATGSLNFTGTVGTATAAQNVAVTAPGGNTSNVSITSCAFAGTNSADFAFSPAQMFPIALAPGGTVNLPVAFTAGAVGARTAQLNCDTANATTASFSVTLNGQGNPNVPVIAATKSVAGSFNPGGAVTYTIVISNTGAGAQGDNTGDEFVDILPAQLTLNSASASSGTAVATSATRTVTWNGSIAAGASVTITINATINNTLGTVSNQGTVNADLDANGTNEAVVTTDDPALGGAADATVFAIGGNLLSIPVLSDWSRLLAVLGVLMAGLVFWRVRANAA